MQPVRQDTPVLQRARYHSLMVEFPPPSTSHPGTSPDVAVEPIAWCRGNALLNDDHDEDDAPSCVMALRHKTNPHYGVQFHPESVGTGEVGYRLLKYFCSFCVDWRGLGSVDGDGGGVVNSATYSSTGVDGNVPVIDMDDDLPLRGTMSYTRDSLRPNTVTYPGRNGKWEESSDGHHNHHHCHGGNSTADTNGITDPNGGADISSEEEMRDGARPSRYRILVHKMEFSPLSSNPLPPPSPERVFERIYASMDTSFWLDSSTGRKDSDVRNVGGRTKMKANWPREEED